MMRNEFTGQVEYWRGLKNDWPRFAKEILNVSLDDEQVKILRDIQGSQKISVRSGHARGKDFLAAVAALCFFYLNGPCKVICTAPTDRQVVSIMMSEISKIHMNAKLQLPGRLYSKQLKIDGEPDWFLLAFKAAENKTEAWTGFHAPRIFIIATEASGLSDRVFDAIEGLLTGDSKLLVVFNPNDESGEAYRSTTSPYYKKHKLSCLTAPNVSARKNIIPGQVDYDYVKERVVRWCQKIEKEVFSEDKYDFEFEGSLYRPNDLFRVKILGEFPGESQDRIISMRWVEMAFDRWGEKDISEIDEDLKLGVDVAGMGTNETVFTYRYGDYVLKQESISMPGDPEAVHMHIVGKIRNALRQKSGDAAYIDTIGEGAGVFSRLYELSPTQCVSVKASGSAKGLTDLTEERSFANMRAFLVWAIRDALDPAFGGSLALPQSDYLLQDLIVQRIHKVRSDGAIVITPKETIKGELGRSPDWGDSLFLTASPVDSEAPFIVGSLGAR